MNKNYLILGVGAILLVLVFSNFSFASTITGIQEQLQSIQLKLIKEKIKLIQEKISGLSPVAKPEVGQIKEEAPSREELSKRIETQLAVLEKLIKDLKPRAIVEETARLEKRIGEIGSEIRTADGARLEELKNELKAVLGEYSRLEKDVQEALLDDLKRRQALLIQEQIRALQVKIQNLPRVSVAPIIESAKVVDEEAKKKQIGDIKSQIEAVQLRLVTEQIKAIQKRIEELRAK